MNKIKLKPSQVFLLCLELFGNLYVFSPVPVVAFIVGATIALLNWRIAQRPMHDIVTWMKKMARDGLTIAGIAAIMMLINGWLTAYATEGNIRPSDRQNNIILFMLYHAVEQVLVVRLIILLAAVAIESVHRRQHTNRKNGAGE